MTDQPQKTDAEKLKLFAFEVQQMQLLQDRYFKIHGSGTNDQVKAALAKAKAQEAKVRKLVIKVLSPQTELGL